MPQPHAVQLILITLMLGSIACGAERSMADGFAAAGAAQAANGKTEQAKDLLYKALVYDDSCPDALFELAKIMDKENNPLALAFFQRAASLYEKESKPTPAKKSEAEKRLKALDAYGPRLSLVMEEYALELDKIVKKLPDNSTRDAATERAATLGLGGLIPAEKLPKFLAAAQGKSSAPEKNVAVAGDATKELKALGWTRVLGTVVKKSAGVYVLTDAKLEADKITGGIDVIVHKAGFDGNVVVTVRTDSNNAGGEEGGKKGEGKKKKHNRDGVDGYGFLSNGDEFSLYTPADKGKTAYPALFFSRNWPDAQAKAHLQVSITDALDLYLNDKREAHSGNTRISRSGTFVIEVQGTVTVEAPRCSGQ